MENLLSYSQAALLSAIAVVLTMHTEDQGICWECIDSDIDDGHQRRWPCPTYKAVMQCLEGEV